MVKGVNRHIVEINRPENNYFEKAILYIRRDQGNITEKELQRQAQIYLNSLSPLEGVWEFSNEKNDNFPNTARSGLLKNKRRYHMKTLRRYVLWTVGSIAIAAVSFLLGTGLLG